MAAKARPRGKIVMVPRRPNQESANAIHSGLSAAPMLPPTEKIDMPDPRLEPLFEAAMTAAGGWKAAEPKLPRAIRTSSIL